MNYMTVWKKRKSNLSVLNVALNIGEHQRSIVAIPIFRLYQILSIRWRWATLNMYISVAINAVSLVFSQKRYFLVSSGIRRWIKKRSLSSYFYFLPALSQRQRITCSMLVDMARIVKFLDHPLTKTLLKVCTTDCVERLAIAMMWLCFLLLIAPAFLTLMELLT